jgi:protein tyrosine/serine phosphatase
MIRKSLRNFSAALIAVFCFSIFAAAQTSISTAAFSNVKIGNFGQMDERFYRGAQPLEGEYQSLKDLGVNTVIDLRNDPVAYEKTAVEALGMKYVNIPMSVWKSPQQADVDAFLALVDKPDTGKFYVHCKAGIHRTGVVGAAYRYTKYGWDYDQVYKEMKDYNYSNGLVHGKLGSFVKKLGSRHADEKVKAAAAQPIAAVTQGTDN